MKTVNDYLDDMKEKLGSDYKTAKFLKVPGASITTMRKRGRMSDETAIKIADLLEIDRSEVLIAAAIARSEGEVKKSWINVSKMAGIAACTILATTLSIQAIEPFLMNYQYQKCILC